MWGVLQELPGWFGLLVALAGAIVAGASLGRSRWAAVLLGAGIAGVLSELRGRSAPIRGGQGEEA